jgi:NADPH2 dehydrogenase
MIQIRKLDTPERFRQHLDTLGIELPFDDELDGSLRPEHFAVLPMEGWDATDDGRPTELVERRWQRFGESGAHLIWGGEAVAVRMDGRANPHQLVIGNHVARLRDLLADDQHVGLQLTHSGRWSHAQPRSAMRHEFLDGRRPAEPFGDDELDELRSDYVRAAEIAKAAGFDFVDVKACHGYLLHELLGAGRLDVVGSIVEAVREVMPVAVRLSVFDALPPDTEGEAPGPTLEQSLAIIDRLQVTMVCVTAGSPYYCPHVQRPAYFPPSDGYPPPEDPLVGVARLIDAAATVKAARPELTVVGSGYSYLQEWLPNVAQAAVRTGTVDVVGLGRMTLSYPDLPADVVAGRPLDKRKLCRTFSDCTTAPRNGLVSGCWPLDDFYKHRPDRAQLVAAKRGARSEH